LNTFRLIIAAGAVAYASGVLLAYVQQNAVDHTPILFINLLYAIVLLVGSYVSDRVRQNITTLMAIAIYAIQTHALYLIWENDLAPSLVAACSSIALAPIATFGYAFKTLRQLLPFLLLTIAAVLAIAFTVEEPRVDRSVFVVTNVALCGVCFIAATGQLRTLASLQQNSLRQRALVDAIPDAMLRLDHEGTILDTSIDPSTRLGQYVAAGNLKEELAVSVSRILADGAENRELSLNGLDGEPLSIELRMVPSGQGEVTAILRDVTSEKTIKARLMVADRMGALGTLSVGIGHEINNPLTYIESNLRFAIEEITDSEADEERDTGIVEALEDAVEGARRVKVIVDDLKRSVRNEDDPENRVSNASSAINFAVRVAGSQLRHQAVLDCQIPEEIAVIGSESKLGQVFLNLIVNAMQAFEDPTRGNRIQVRADLSDPDFATVTVEDNGPGIPREIQTRIFDPFFTTKEIGEGTGLGLYICHQIVKDCGGELTIDSAPGKGTKVSVKLPRATLTSESDKKARVEDGHPLRVLVIDDEPGILRVCARMLDKHEVTTCGEAPKALELISDGDYDAIICDLMMPKMTGMQLHESVERDFPEKANRMVFITGGAFRSDAESFLEAHAEQYLPKPFSRDSLLGAVDRIKRRAS
jgi:signal transduction histidine kinase/ActR/RegA family two-component response regulator